MERRKINNKGFSLVELIIAVAIMLIVGGSITGFLIAGTGSYKQVNGDANLQREAQVSMNQISDMILNASKAIVRTSNGLMIYNKNERTLITKAAGENRVYYEKETLRADKSGFDKTPSGRSPIADYVTAFSCEVPHTNSNSKVVTVNMTLENNDRSYTKKESIMLRNDVLFEDPLDKLYPTEKEAIKVNEITISTTMPKNSAGKYTAFVRDIGKYRFIASVTGEGSNPPSQDVVWVVESKQTSAGPAPDGSEDDTQGVTQMVGNSNASLVMGNGDRSSVISVYAISKQDPSKMSKSIEILVKRVTGVSLTPATLENLPPGKQFSVRGEVHGDNLEPADKQLLWKFSGLTNKSTTVDGEATLIVKKNVNKIKIEAKSKANSNVSKVLETNVESKAIREVQIKLLVPGGKEQLIEKAVTLKLNQSVTFKADVLGDHLENADMQVIWEAGDTGNYDVEKKNSEIQIKPIQTGSVKLGVRSRSKPSVHKVITLKIIK